MLSLITRKQEKPEVTEDAYRIPKCWTCMDTGIVHAGDGELGGGCTVCTNSVWRRRPSHGRVTLEGLSCTCRPDQLALQSPSCGACQLEFYNKVIANAVKEGRKPHDHVVRAARFYADQLNWPC